MPKRNFDPCSHVGETHGIYTIIDVLDEREALNKALSIANNGDIVIVFYEDMDKLIEVLKT